MKNLTSFLFYTLSISLFLSCGSVAPIISTPVENIDNTPLKFSELTKGEKQIWGHLDLVKDTIPGMSINKAYGQIIKNRKGNTVIVAVIDSGIDIDHEDLDDVIWRNKGEKANNGKDDDNNGYIDDIHGWNFLGDAYNEQFELTRIIAKGDTSHPDYNRALQTHADKYNTFSEYKKQYDQIYQQLMLSDEVIAKHLNKKEYSVKELNAIETKDETLKNHIGFIRQLLSNGYDTVSELKEALKDDLEEISNHLNYYLNKDFKGRTAGDNPDVIDNTFYGNNNVKPTKKTESHGTHVAGIIAAERNNGKGVNGVAKNVKIMALRAVPNGDEYDKDVALAIRYAVDNGAQVINASFGKSFSPHSDWVRDAIKYASDNDVVFVHAAGNDSKNVDVEPNFPDDNINGNEISNTYIRVGALTSKYGSGVVASFSNYGKNNVDVFAPGSGIYSTTPQNEYDSKGGTSMAAPAVAGIAAMIRSYYPKLSASQIKQIILDSGLPLKPSVVVGGEANNIKPFSELSKSGKVANLYNALIMAEHVSQNK